MSDQDSGTSASGADGGSLEAVPFMQRLLDNNWALMVLGLVVPTVVYIFWGLWDVMHIPAAQ